MSTAVITLLHHHTHLQQFSYTHQTRRTENLTLPGADPPTTNVWQTVCIRPPYFAACFFV
jgi:hypothetical protein